MPVTYLRNENGQFERVGPGGASTDTTLTQAGKPADAAAVGNALANYATKVALSEKVDAVSGKELSSNDFTDEYKANLDALLSQSHNIFSSLT